MHADDKRSNRVNKIEEMDGKRTNTNHGGMRNTCAVATRLSGKCSELVATLSGFQKNISLFNRKMRVQYFQEITEHLFCVHSGSYKQRRVWDNLRVVDCTRLEVCTSSRIVPN